MIRFCSAALLPELFRSRQRARPSCRPAGRCQGVELDPEVLSRGGPVGAALPGATGAAGGYWKIQYPVHIPNVPTAADPHPLSEEAQRWQGSGVGKKG